MIEPDYLRQVLSYNPDTGTLTWLPRPVEAFTGGYHSAQTNAAKWNARYADREAFTATAKGYRKGTVSAKTLLAQRVAWAVFYGRWPEGEIDHINGDRADNRIQNLREVAHVQNQRNLKTPVTNTSGHVGVDWLPGMKRWRVRISERHVGHFKTFDEAVAARRDAERDHGYHENHGRAA